MMLAMLLLMLMLVEVKTVVMICACLRIGIYLMGAYSRECFLKVQSPVLLTNSQECQKYVITTSHKSASRGKNFKHNLNDIRIKAERSRDVSSSGHMSLFREEGILSIV